MNFKEDELKDIELIKFIRKEESDPKKFAERLSNNLTQRYGLEFGGTITVTHDPVHKRFTLRTSNGRKFEIEEQELRDLPTHLRILREQNAREKR
ncbi:hypothetical protein HYV81_02130 [Candidatus Woesearchaeota archaeon]|nr:hypothetical protein [Candidatus Woesearchaeota archaeon]